ncbi:catechol O-methyltransferase-like isoform X2 [Narcine bancroftii]|uniref:catechol O-methyltransferase-like isoform X2 n=1 Tax=Narcine bancroftii TaxID=1343680 RepID=UPI003831AC63
MYFALDGLQPRDGSPLRRHERSVDNLGGLLLRRPRPGALGRPEREREDSMPWRREETIYCWIEGGYIVYIDQNSHEDRRMRNSLTEEMEEYLPTISILLASLLLLFFLLPILFKNNSAAAIFWHTVVEEKMAKLVTGKSREDRILEYVLQNAVQGDAKSVVDNIDKYCREKEWAMNVGDEKGAILDRVLEEASPSTVLELGTYCGYSALRMVCVLKPGTRLLTVEFNPTNAVVAKQIFHFAGVEGKVEFLEGASEDIIPQLKRQHKVEMVDFVFLDHWKDQYLPDTRLLEECGLLRKGSVLLADNVISPGAPEFLQYVRNNPHYKCTHYASHLEYTKLKDGMEKAVFKG